MKELVVISGKGGTGKTSIVASFAVLAENAVLADCDVDAADLHLVMAPTIRRRTEFRCGREAVIRQQDCVRCGACLAHCRFEAIRMAGDAAGEATFSVDPVACEGCGVCVHACPVDAVDFPERLCGEWYVSDTRCGPMVHARLGIAADNSGKLVSTVRNDARRVAREQGRELILADGSPGIGCPVIASVTGASLVLAVVEPSLSGEHDLGRVLQLARHFGAPTAVCVNKWDLNPEISDRVERLARSLGAQAIARVGYDRAVTTAQIEGKAVVELPDGVAARDIRKGWQEVCRMMQ